MGYSLWGRKESETTERLLLTHCADTVSENHSFFYLQGKVHTQSPTTTKHAAESPTIGELTGVSTTKLSWINLRPWESQLHIHGISHAS